MPNSSNQRHPRTTNNMNNKKSNPNMHKKTNKKINKKHKMNPKFKMFLKILLVIFLLLCVIGAGVVAALFFGLFGDDFKITKQELTVGTSNSIVLDKDGNEIANLSTDEKRKTVSLSEMSEYLPKAYVAIEDKRFYKHHGVDIKRTASAMIGVITGKDNGGGSTITQQLVKNITKDKARTGLAGITRKVKEWAKAAQVEKMIPDKNQILELYLNIIFVGGNELHGVELGSQYYFNKSAKDLDLAESAFLAGINHSPNAYNPYDEENQEKIQKSIKERTLTVLNEMKKQGLVQDDDVYKAAVAKVEAGLTFTKGDTGSESTYSYHTSAAIKQVIEQVMDEKDISEELARNYVYGSGLTIYSTEDSTIQQRVEEEFAKTKYQIKGKQKNKDGTLKNDHTQAAIVIIDNSTSQVVAVGGKLGDKITTGWNRGTQMIRQTGSSMKPLADIVPGLEEKVITAATMYDDSLTDFGGGYKPDDYNDPKGPINIRSCIKTSQNIPMVKVMAELTPKKSVEYLKKMGITTLTDDESLPLSIGGMSKGISPLEMAGAYESIANDGVYTTPTFYTKVVDKDGNEVLKPKQEKTKVMSEQNAYITRSIIEEPTTAGGTATYCSIPGMETCAKTGSTDNYVDRWLCGMTPYYTAACWFGYDNGQEPLKNGNTPYSVEGKNPAGQIWSSIMKDIHKNLENKKFNVPSSGLVQAQVCRDTGCLATSSCTNVYTETFTPDNLPQKCVGHGVQTVCQASGKIAGQYCPQEQVKTVSYGGTMPKEELGLWNTLRKYSIGGVKTDEVCDIHTKPEEKPVTTTPSTENKPDTKPVENTTNTVDKPVNPPVSNNSTSGGTGGKDPIDDTTIE